MCRHSMRPASLRSPGREHGYPDGTATVGAVASRAVWVGRGRLDLISASLINCLLSSAMGLTTILTTIWLHPLLSTKVQNPYSQGKSDVDGRTGTRCRCLGVKGSRVQISPARQAKHLVSAGLITCESLEIHGDQLV